MNGINGGGEENMPSPHKRRTSKSLLEPTASMVSAMKELNEKKGEIRPEDDPFWEKRGGKGSEHIPKFKEVPVRPSRSIKETLEHLQPLDPSSRLLSTTKAATCATYHKPDTRKELKVAALPSTSHLLTPTKASEAAHFTPPPVPADPTHKPSPKSTSPAHQNSRLMDLTKARQAAAWPKRDRRDDTNSREHGWNEFFARQGQRRNCGGHSNHSSPSSPAQGGMNGTGRSPVAATEEGSGKLTARVNDPYKDVKSKLHNPTVASVRQMWVAEREDPREFDDDEHGVRMDSAAAEAASAEQRRRDARSPYAYVGSRLLAPTASVRSSMWVNRSKSPERLEVKARRSMSPSQATPPSVEGKATRSQLFSQRQKYVKHDRLDVAADPMSRRSSGRVSPSPKPGRILYKVPVARVKPITRKGSSSSTVDSLHDEIPNHHSTSLQVDRVSSGLDSFPEQVNAAMTPDTVHEFQMTAGVDYAAITTSSTHNESTPDVVSMSGEGVIEVCQQEVVDAVESTGEAEDMQGHHEDGGEEFSDADAQIVMAAVMRHANDGDNEQPLAGAGEQAVE